MGLQTISFLPGVVLVVGSAWAAMTSESVPHYEVRERIELDPAVEGAGGSIAIAEDRRMLQVWRESIWESSVHDLDGPVPVFLPARLLICNRRGILLSATPLQSPVARLERRTVSGGVRPVYLVSEQRSAGFGSYSGIVVTLFEVRDATCAEVHAREASTGRVAPIEGLLDSLKTMWRIVPRHGPIREILVVRCRPWSADPERRNDEAGAGGVVFYLGYTRYSFKDGKATRYYREEKGFADFEDRGAFPSRSLFP